jgi:hypothetical protein
VNILAQSGANIGGKTVAQVTSLVGSAGTLADGRWRVDDSHIGMRVTFTDWSQAIYTIPASATSPSQWTLLDQTGVSMAIGSSGAAVTGFGLPGFGADGGCAVVANLAIFRGGAVTAANNVALLTVSSGGAQAVLARKGDAVAADANGNGLTSVAISGFRDPVVGANGQVAFLFTGSGSALFAHPAIGYSSDGKTWSVLANVGASAPGGGHWAGFSSMVLPEGAKSGPIFVGTLAISRADGVNATNNLGLWAVDSTGALRRLLSTADSMTAGGMSKRLKTFRALTPSTSLGGVASGYDNTADVSVTATFTDRSAALVNVPVP